jgi:hypothetical protein
MPGGSQAKRDEGDEGGKGGEGNEGGEGGGMPFCLPLRQSAAAAAAAATAEQRRWDTASAAAAAAAAATAFGQRGYRAPPPLPPGGGHAAAVRAARRDITTAVMTAASAGARAAAAAWSKVPWLATTLAVTHRSGSPHACSGLLPRTERSAPAAWMPRRGGGGRWLRPLAFSPPVSTLATLLEPSLFGRAGGALSRRHLDGDGA